MKKNVLSTLVFLTSLGFASAQVGINQMMPKASLDVKASDQATIVDGVLVPRLTVTELALKDGIYLADQNGALVFVTAGVGTAGKTIDIKTPGFYYYDSNTSKWTSMGGSSAVPSAANVVYTSSSSYTLLGTEDIILFTSPNPTILTINKNLLTAAEIGKVIYIQTWNDQLDVDGAGLRGDALKVAYTKRAAMLIYVQGTDGLGEWLFKN